MFDHAVELWTHARVVAEMEIARTNLGRELEDFTANTLRYVREDKALLVEPIELPPLVGVPPFSKRHVVIVVRAKGTRKTCNRFAPTYATSDRF